MSTDELSGRIAEHLPYLRRYARALTGSQATGDAHAAATLEAILADSRVIDPDLEPKAALFRVFHRLWHSGGAPSKSEESGPRAAAHAHDRRLHLPEGAFIEKKKAPDHRIGRQSRNEGQ